MKVYNYVLSSLWHFRRQKSAVIAAVMISTAVLTGALIIGDSVSYTLRKMVDTRLGKVRYAMQTGDRFVRSKLADELSQNTRIIASPLLAVQAISINPENSNRINKTSIYGFDSSFWLFSNAQNIYLKDDEVLINENTAQKLGLQAGNEIVLRIENAEKIPINTPFASTENPVISQRFIVKAILKKEQLGNFSLKSNQAEPFNVFISKSVLEQKLGLSGLANLIVLGINTNSGINPDTLSSLLRDEWKPEDLGLKMKQTGIPGQYEIVSDRIFIDKKISDLLMEKSNMPVLTYLVNSIRKGKNETPYSFVSALDTKNYSSELEDSQIIINNWLAEDLNIKTGDSIELTWYQLGPLRQLYEVMKKFQVKKIIPVENLESLKSLMPDFPGMNEAGDCSDWETGVPIDLKKIRDKDEKYWDIFKGTPKAFISINYGQKIWQNEFGNLTALRFDSAFYPPNLLKQELMMELKPLDFRFIFEPVYQQGVDATINAVDFGELFLSLSFFVIVSGVLLTLLIHVFNSGSRSFETALFSGLGYAKGQILSIKMFEAVFLLIPAGILGAFLGIIYNFLIMQGINSVWNDAVRTSMIEVHIKLPTLIIGAVSGIVISFLSIWFVNRRILNLQVAVAIKQDINTSVPHWKKKLYKRIAFSLILVSIILTAFSILSSIELNASLFLVSGALFLLGLVVMIYQWIDYQILEKRDDSLTYNSLVLKNAGRNKARSIASIVLLALGTFVVIITGANRKTYFEAEYSNSSGTGGYLFWAETSVPVAYNLNSVEGKSKSGFNPDDLPEELKFTQFYNLDGDDASCLNLNQVQKPRILGVNALEFSQRGSFSFAKLMEGIDPDKAWQALYKNEDKNVVPAIADQTVLTWGLKKAVGDTLIYLNERGEKVNFVIIGGLNNSIFQGNLLISDSLFKFHFPSAGGSKIMLIDAPNELGERIRSSLSNTLSDYGIEITTANQRLAEFNSITNTYLSVFMALGGLGMIIGTVGLGIVILRNIQERKAELALMQALGFTKNQIFTLILKENVFILLTGITSGILAAFIGILPGILSPSFEIPGTFMFALIALVVFNGLIWIYFPVKKALKFNIIQILREE